jgi:hypothetical protein
MGFKGDLRSMGAADADRRLFAVSPHDPNLVARESRRQPDSVAQLTRVMANLNDLPLLICNQ